MRVCRGRQPGRRAANGGWKTGPYFVASLPVVAALRRVQRAVVVPQVSRVMTVEYVDEVVQVPFRRKVRRTVEVPQVHTNQRFVAVPAMVQVERLVEVPMIAVVDENRQEPVQRKVRRTGDVSYVRTVPKFVDVPVPRRVEQSVQVPRIEVVDVIVQVPVERRAQRTVEVPQFRKVRRVGGVPVTPQGKQIVEVLKRGRLVLVADPGIEVVDEIVQALVERRAQRTVEVPQFRKARRGGGVPVTRQGKQIGEVLKRGRLVLALGSAACTLSRARRRRRRAVSLGRMALRVVAGPGIEVVGGIVQVLGGTAAVRHREDLRLARGGARQPLDVLFPVASRRAGGGPRRGSWRRVRRGPRRRI